MVGVRKNNGVTVKDTLNKLPDMGGQAYINLQRVSQPASPTGSGTIFVVFWLEKGALWTINAQGPPGQPPQSAVVRLAKRIYDRI